MTSVIHELSLDLSQSNGDAPIHSQPRAQNPHMPPVVHSPCLRVFIGYDPRQSISYSVLQHSLLKRSSRPLQITPLVINQLPITRQGLTPFTFSRFLVPWLCNYQGWALFMDADMIALDDIAKLFDYMDDRYAMMVSKNVHQFEWASVMLFNCAKCQVLTPEFVQNDPHLFSFHYLPPEALGSFPGHWNHLVGYDTPNPEAALVHFTQGVPAFPEVAGCEYTNAWAQEFSDAFHCDSWESIMGQSVHTAQLHGARVPKFKAKAFYHQNQIYSREFPSERYEQLLQMYTHMHTHGDPARHIPPEQMFSGISLPHHAETIRAFFGAFPIQTILDYGCGKAQQYRIPFTDRDGEKHANIPTYWGNPKIFLYDPAFPPFQRLPKKPCDAVICTDVLEHLPETDLDWILAEICSRARHAVYMSVATYPAKKQLPNGENAHTTIQPSSWWKQKIAQIHAHFPHLAIQLAIDSITPEQTIAREYAFWK